jgi:hypothetical protein
MEGGSSPEPADRAEEVRKRKHGRMLKARERERAILELRGSGATFRSIADRFSISDKRALELYYRALDRVVTPEVERERKQQLLRIDHHELLISARLAQRRQEAGSVENDQAIARLSLAFLRWEERRARALGSDAAPNIVVNIGALDLSKLSEKQINELKDKLWQIDGRYTIKMIRSMTAKLDAKENAERDERTRQVAAAQRQPQALEPEIIEQEPETLQRARRLLGYQPGPDGVLVSEDRRGNAEIFD